MITRHNIKAYALANGWSETPNAIEGLEVFEKNNLVISFPIVVNPETETHSIYYAVDKICSDELGNVIDVYNRIDNQWLPFDPENIPEAKEGYSLLIMHPNFAFPLCFNYSLHEKDKWEEYKDYAELSGYRYPKDSGYQYKLVPLPQSSSQPLNNA
jgi:hypothetical protein